MSIVRLVLMEEGGRDEEVGVVQKDEKQPSLALAFAPRSLLGPAVHLFLVVWRLGSLVHEYDGHGPQARRRRKQRIRRRTTNIKARQEVVVYVV